MTYHLAGWSASVDQAAIAPIAALADPALTVSGNNIQVPDYGGYLVGAFGTGVNLTRYQIQSPSLRRIVNYEVAPLNYAATAPTAPALVDLFRNPIALDVGEQMQAYCSEDGAGATRMNAFVLLGDGKVDAITDPIFSVRVTAAQALTAFAWTFSSLVFDQVLPVGDYAVVGAKMTSTTLLAFRLLFQAQTARPGGIGQTNMSHVTLPGQRMGGWGVWGIFNSTTPPGCDFLAGAADAAEVGVLDLIKVG